MTRTHLSDEDAKAVMLMLRKELEERGYEPPVLAELVVEILVVMALAARKGDPELKFERIEQGLRSLMEGTITVLKLEWKQRGAAHHPR